MRDHLATASIPFAWGTWIFGHIVEINQILQTCAFLASITLSIAGILHYFAKRRRDR